MDATARARFRKDMVAYLRDCPEVAGLIRTKRGVFRRVNASM